jgi:hypothetical protein
VLTIRKHPLSLKAATLGTIAFVIGLGGAAMYMERFRQHENLVFGRAETVLGASDARSAEQKSPANETQNATSTQQTGSPQASEGSVSAAPAASSAGSVATTPAPATTTTTPTPAPGMGGGASGATTPSGTGGTTTEPVGDLPLLSCLQNCVLTPLQNTTGGLVNP